MSITITDTNVTVLSDQMMLAKVNEALAAIALGKSYSITGSRSWTNLDTSELLEMQSFYERRVLAQKGGIGQNTSDFSGDNQGAAGT